MEESKLSKSTSPSLARITDFSRSTTIRENFDRREASPGPLAQRKKVSSTKAVDPAFLLFSKQHGFRMSARHPTSMVPMDQLSQKKLHSIVRKIENKVFPDFFDLHFSLRLDKAAQAKHFYHFFAPSHHLKPAVPLVTSRMIADLQNGKKMLSVGAGPAHLEMLLTYQFSIAPANVVLSDHLKYDYPECFRSLWLDMFLDWSQIRSKFDYIIFPESPLLGAKRLREPENPLGRMLGNAYRHLKPRGEIRINGLFWDPGPRDDHPESTKDLILRIVRGVSRKAKVEIIIEHDEIRGLFVTRSP